MINHRIGEYGHRKDLVRCSTSITLSPKRGPGGIKSSLDLVTFWVFTGVQLIERAIQLAFSLGGP